MIDWTPGSIALQIGPVPVYWYGICYAVGLAVAYVVMVAQARRLTLDPAVLANGMIVVAVAALIGGRLYHVIDQFNACPPAFPDAPCYSQNLLRIVLPPYSGLGVYGGLITGTIAFIAYARYQHIDPWAYADVVAPGLFTMQAIGRLGNCTAPPRICRGASRSIASTASTRIRATASPSRRRTSSRCSSTNRCRAWSAPWCSSGSPGARRRG